MVVKFVATRAGSTACAALAARGIPTLLTAIYDPGQAIVAAAAGATYIAPYLGRMNDAGRQGIAEVVAMHEVLVATGSSTKVLLASIRSVPDMVAWPATASTASPWRRKSRNSFSPIRPPPRRRALSKTPSARPQHDGRRRCGPSRCGRRRCAHRPHPTTTVRGHLAYEPHPGGSCLNVAVGLGRLGVPTAFLARLSSDAFGQMLRAQLADSGVQESYFVDTDDLTTLAAVHLRGGQPTYSFHAQGAADRGLLPEHLTPLPDSAALHLGSIAHARAGGHHA